MRIAGREKIYRLCSGTHSAGCSVAEYIAASFARPQSREQEQAQAADWSIQTAVAVDETEVKEQSDGQL